MTEAYKERLREAVDTLYFAYVTVEELYDDPAERERAFLEAIRAANPLDVARAIRETFGGEGPQGLTG